MNFATEKATIVFDPGVVSAEALVQAVEAAGYGVVTATATLPILGMTCASCVSRVERALRKPAGVLDAAVNLATEKATVTYLPGQATRDDLVEAVRAAGYDVAEQPAAGSVRREGAPRTPAKPAAPRPTAPCARKVIAGAVLSVVIFVGTMQARLVPLPARLAVQRVRAVGAGHAGAVLGGRPVLPHRLGRPAPRHHDHEHAHRHGLVGGLLLQRRSACSSPRSSSTRGSACPCTSTRPPSSSP